MSWDEIREIPIPELGEDMTFGRSCESLRKSWYALKRSRKEGSYYNKDLEFRINRIQSALGFPRTHFDDLDQEWVDQELSREEQQLKREEDESEEVDEELSNEEQQLKKEEETEELAGWGLDEDDEKPEDGEGDDSW
jgi:hypothetical protein